MSGPDRLALLLDPAQNAVTGIDFVYVEPNQVELFVFFLHDDPLAVLPSLNNLAAAQIVIQSATDTTPAGRVPVAQVIAPWPLRDGRRVLHLQVAGPGGFTGYRLRIADPRIDPYFNDVAFSFKANCPSELDCEAEPRPCPADAPVDFPVDYRARDFWSWRQALLDFASQRYPDWQDRLEADLGITLVELMSALGDEFAYAQDRIAREAHLETASQRRSLRHLARLVDYPLDDGRGATVWLDVQVAAAGALAAGVAVSDALGQLVFETGRGLREDAAAFPLVPARNRLLPHLWDEDDTCLHAGATRLTIAGNHVADLQADPAIDPLGRWIALITSPDDPGLPARRWIVRLAGVAPGQDPLTATPVTEVTWDAAFAPPFDLDLATLEIRANLVPATSGRTDTAWFSIGPSTFVPPTGRLLTAVERVGANGSLAYPDLLPQGPQESERVRAVVASARRSTLHLFSLPGSEATPLVWLPGPSGMRPELRVRQDGREWTWLAALIGPESAKPNDPVFTLEDGSWRAIDRYRDPRGDVVHVDYASDAGATLRFGDDEFGRRPRDGDVFSVDYRLGPGRLGNAAADTLVLMTAAPGFVSAVNNPLPAFGGADPEPAQDIRTNAPEAFRAVTYRAVRPEDYAEAAERLPWVQRAGAVLRWTGCWASLFATPDPRDAFALSPAQRSELEAQMERFRQAGREVHVRDPRHADLDLEIRVCVAPGAYRAEVMERVLQALFGRAGLAVQQGFFDPDRFTFGTPLVRSALLAAVQDVAGVRAVEGIRLRRRGWFDWREFRESEYRAGDNELIRVANNRLLPERGAVRLLMEGGA